MTSTAFEYMYGMPVAMQIWIGVLLLGGDARDETRAEFGSQRRSAALSAAGMCPDRISPRQQHCHAHFAADRQ